MADHSDRECLWPGQWPQKEKVIPTSNSSGKIRKIRASLYVWYLQYWALCDGILNWKPGITYMFSIITIESYISFVRFDSLRPRFQVNNFSVMSGLILMCGINTKRRIKCLAQGHNTVFPSVDIFKPATL